MINGVIKSNNNVSFFMRFFSSSFLDGASKAVGKSLIAMYDSCRPFLAHLSNFSALQIERVDHSFISLFA
jgi:hypothetical protein